MSTESFASSSSVEVTHEDFQLHYANRKKFRIRDLLLQKKPLDKRQVFVTTSEMVSVASLTVTSNETVRASNKTGKNPITSQKKSAKNSWDMLRSKFHNKLMKISNGDSMPKTTSSLRRRIAGDRSTDGSSITEEKRSRMDDAMRGRMDGIDTLSLGPAKRVTNRQTHLFFDDFDEFIEGMNGPLTPSKIVMDMISLSAGRDPPEMILEGFIPGGDDRWRVSMEEPLILNKGSATESTNGWESPVPGLLPTNSSDCGSCFSCGEEDIHNLMGSLWGSEPPPPTHVTAIADPADDDILQMATSCNVPIDVDEEAFMIETAQHLRSVHDIASMYLRKKNYEGALTIFNKILKGLKMRNDEHAQFLIGAALHNIGLIQMWQGHFHESLLTFQQAIATRTSVLPSQHPDIAVSIVRLSFAQFALQDYPRAEESLKIALRFTTAENATRAKILNNLGVVQFYAKRLIHSLQNFAAALEIQRQWLEGPVRRESIVFDASITLQNMGKFYLAKSDFGTSHEIYEEAHAVSLVLFCRIDNCGNRKLMFCFPSSYWEVFSVAIAI
jgi:Tetratricopeptide repeat